MPKSDPVQETLRSLKEARERSDSVLVGYSGGKDAIATLDLCLRTFTRVECFFMYLVQGLEHQELMLDWVRKHFGVKIHTTPHWLLSRALKEGTYSPETPRTADLPEWTLRDVYDHMIVTTGIPMIATGAKLADSLWRRRCYFNATKHWTEMIYPVKTWKLFTVQGYLRARGLPCPKGACAAASGVDLSTESLLWLHDTYPGDFQQLCEVFPYAPAVLYRRKFHGEAP